MSELFIKTVNQDGVTVMADRFFSSPLKIAKPFYRDDGFTEITVMSASPGMLGGDAYDLRLDLGGQTKTMISGQSYQKLFNTGSGLSAQNLNIRVGGGAVLCYLPYPVIPFVGSRFRSRTEVRLQRSSKLFLGEILVGGRLGMGERFVFTEFTSRVAVAVDERPVFLDHNRLIPAEMAVGGIGFFEGYACQGLLYVYGYDQIALPKGDGIEAAVSKARAGYTVRILGDSGDAVYQFMKNIFLSVVICGQTDTPQF